MKRFMVIMRQDGEGCDYSIGCGIKYKIYEASSAEEAFMVWVDDHDLNLPHEPSLFKYYGDTDGEGYLKKVMVFELGDTNEHLWPEFIARRKAEIAVKQLSEKEAKERAEYEKLKQKFG